MKELLDLGSEAHYRDPEYYDQTYRRRRHDVRFYADLAIESGGPVLELGVGTGRVAIELARLGIEIVGVDRMETMLAQAERRLKKLPRATRKKVHLVCGDIREITLGRRFALVISPFNVLNHIYATADFQRVLAVARRHLRAGGRFAFDVMLPDPYLLCRDPDRIYRGRPVTLPESGRRCAYSETFQYDTLSQVLLTTMAFRDLADPTFLQVTPLAHRQWFPEELVLQLEHGGFGVEARFGDFDRAPIARERESQIVIARARRKRRAS